MSPWTLGGRLAGQHLANDAGASYGYNARGLLGWMESDDEDQTWYGAYGGPGQSGMIGYDATGNRTQMGVTGSLSDSVVHPGNVYYTYNTKDQLTNETSTRVGGTLNQGFAYDDAFNPTTLRSTGNIPYNDNNQRTGPQTYVYDGNGNPTTYKGYILTYDVENRLTAYASTMYAGYNGDGLRAWKDNDNNAGNGRTYFLYDGSDLLCELNSSGTVTAINTWGANGLVSRRVGTTSVFYAYDPQGNVAQRLDSSGNVVSSDLYDAYGNRLSTTDTTGDPYRYNGQWGYYTDSETGLALCTHRYYEPVNGRWLTRDPIGYDGGINLYGYVGGNPVGRVDPDGLRRDELDITGANAAAEAGDWYRVRKILGNSKGKRLKRAQEGVLTSLEEELTIAVGKYPCSANKCLETVDAVLSVFTSVGLNPTVLKIVSEDAPMLLKDGRRISSSKYHYAAEWSGRIFDSSTGNHGKLKNDWLSSFQQTPIIVGTWIGRAWETDPTRKGIRY